jgi:hypothetical protein
MKMTTGSMSAIGLLAVIVTFSVSPARTDRGTQGRAATGRHSEWVAQSLNRIQQIKVGATRAELLKIFREEGGLSTRAQRTYVYHECPYIKVDVEFKPVAGASNGQREDASDEIVKISRPYLALSISD